VLANPLRLWPIYDFRRMSEIELILPFRGHKKAATNHCTKDPYLEEVGYINQ
jgi:hypothetical protein